MISPYHFLVADRGYGLTKFWIKSGPREEVLNGAENATSLAAIGVQNGASSDAGKLPVISPEF